MSQCDPREWGPFVLSEYDFSDFAQGAFVLDVGCGEGTQLLRLEQRGCVSLGLDLAISPLLRCRQRNLPVVRARAEALPIRTGKLDGIICKVALPYTEERLVVREFARVLKPGGRAFLSCHAAGYYVRYFTFSPSAKRLVYSARTFLNTWWYALTGRRLPGFLGDTVYQSRRRLRLYYRENALQLTSDQPAPNYLGLPVFLYHQVSKVGGPGISADLSR